VFFFFIFLILKNATVPILFHRFLEVRTLGGRKQKPPTGHELAKGEKFSALGGGGAIELGDWSFNHTRKPFPFVVAWSDQIPKRTWNYWRIPNTNYTRPTGKAIQAHADAWIHETFLRSHNEVSKSGSRGQDIRSSCEIKKEKGTRTFEHGRESWKSLLNGMETMSFEDDRKIERREGRNTEGRTYLDNQTNREPWTVNPWTE